MSEKLFAECVAKVMQPIEGGKAGLELKQFQLDGLLQLLSILGYHCQQGIVGTVIIPICEKKIEYILQATSVTQVKEILKPSVVRYNGCGFVPTTKYHIDEEEMLMWSMASLKAPLNHEATKRYMELFAAKFPDANIERTGGKI